MTDSRRGLVGEWLTVVRGRGPVPPSVDLLTRVLPDRRIELELRWKAAPKGSPVTRTFRAFAVMEPEQISVVRQQLADALAVALNGAVW